MAVAVLVAVPKVIAVVFTFFIVVLLGFVDLGNKITSPQLNRN